MDKKDQGGSAFPVPADATQGWPSEEGMSLREYACIKLKVPDSGKEWLDKIILKSLRNDFAGEALIANADHCGPKGDVEEMASRVYEISDAMIKELKYKTKV